MAVKESPFALCFALFLSQPFAMAAPSDTFDYIVVGGGTAGPVAARRLAEYLPNASILLLEAGPRHENILASTMAMGWEGIHHSRWDWKYTSQPLKHANNRQIHLPRGRFLGGSSGANGTLMIRGVRNDYDRFAALGNVGWSWEEVLPFFKKSETFHAHDQHLPFDPTVHGDKGPLHTSFHHLAPISQRIVDSFLENGLEWKPNMFYAGENQGVGHVPRTVYKGSRTSGADFVSGDGVPSNLTVRCNIQAVRILLSEGPGGDKVAKGIEARDDETGAPLRFDANAEITVSCGAYNSPQLLMLSGIGPKDQLDRFNIPIQVELPGVGENLQDHIITFNFFNVSEPKITNDHFVYDDGALMTALEGYMQDKSGIMGRFPFGAFVFRRLDKELETNSPEWREAKAKAGGKDPVGAEKGMPHVEFFYSELYGGGPQHVHQPGPGESAFGLITLLFNPQARGTVKLQSRNPLFPPAIDHAYLSSPLDLAVLAEANRFGADVVLNGSATKEIVTGPWPRNRTLPQTHEEWKEYVRQQAGTCYHASGTCAMGPSPQPSPTLTKGAVVDPRLRVFGVKNLRVADVSILPLVNTGHTQAPAYMIGEKVAYMVAQDAGATTTLPEQLRSRDSGSNPKAETSARL